MLLCHIVSKVGEYKDLHGKRADCIPPWYDEPPSPPAHVHGDGWSGSFDSVEDSWKVMAVLAASFVVLVVAAMFAYRRFKGRHGINGAPLDAESALLHEQESDAATIAGTAAPESDEMVANPLAL